MLKLKKNGTLRMESPMNIRLLRNGSVLVWISSLRWWVHNTHQCTSMMKENADESFNLKIEIVVKIWVYCDNWGAFCADRGWAQASQVCCNSLFYQVQQNCRIMSTSVQNEQQIVAILKMYIEVGYLHQWCFAVLITVVLTKVWSIF